MFLHVSVILSTLPLPAQADTPYLGKHPRADTPWADTPLGQIPPLGRHPPGQTSPPVTATAVAVTAIATDDTHPTGMHSCLMDLSDKAWTGPRPGQNWLARYYVDIFTLQLYLYLYFGIRSVPVPLKFYRNNNKLLKRKILEWIESVDHKKIVEAPTLRMFKRGLE